MKLRTRIVSAFTALVMTTGLAACGNGAQSDANTISYWLWDSAQQPGYQQCADAFETENPGLKVQITQMGWGDYWQKLTAGFVSGTAPDVFTDHLSKFADFADLGVIEPLGNQEATKNLDASQYQEGLADLWKGQDGQQYGVPKDWDTVAMIYNKQMLDDAGITAEQLNSATWNPQDGGTFEKIIARLTIDKKGKRGDEPGFDAKNVAVYGFAQNGSGGMMGQTSWSSFAFSNGFQFADQNPWGTKLNYGDSSFTDTFAWLTGLIKKGYTPDLASYAGGNFGANQQFAAKKAAISQDGSWMISTYSSFKEISWGIAATPVGTTGERASMFNGLADSISSQSTKKDKAAKWVAFMGSRACQDLIAKAGVVFPAQKESTTISVQTRKDKGIDVSGYLIHVTAGTTHLAPVTKRPNRLDRAISPVLEEIMMGQSSVTVMTATNEKLNNILIRGY